MGNTPLKDSTAVLDSNLIYKMVNQNEKMIFTVGGTHSVTSGYHSITNFPTSGMIFYLDRQ
jgi:hypothetical protein